MKLLTLEIQGFRSFQQPQTLNIGALKPGLYHVTGENQLEPELEGNAVGKSSLFDAFHWMLFDRTSRGLRAGNVKSWTGKLPCEGILTLETASGVIGIFKSWSPNMLEALVDGEEPRTVTQVELEAMGGLSPEAFQAAIYFAQFSPSFADLRPGDQMALFTSILKLGFWERAADVAKDKAAEAVAGAAELRDQLARAEGQAQELLAVDYDAKAAAWERERLLLSAKAKETAAGLEAELEAVSNAAAAAHEGAQAFRTARDRVNAQAAVCARHGTSLKAIDQQLAALRADDLENCPTCGQPVDASHVRAEIKKLEARRAKEAAEGDKALTEHDKLLKAMTALRAADAEHAEAIKQVGHAESMLDMARHMLKVIKGETNPHAADAAKAASRAQELVTFMESLEKDIADAEQEAAAAQYWIKGFREVRLMLIRESLAQAQVEANEVLFQLGLRDWSVEFDVEKETKAGTVSKGFTVLIHSPHSKGPVPWEAWSGGESQRLRLGIAMGFSNLICARLGVAPNVEFWDEPSSWLPRGGIKNLLEVLSERAVRMNKAILLADHRVFDFGGFAGRINIIKDKAGSRIELAV